MIPDLEKIYNEYHGKVMGYIRARISRWAEAEDLCADVFEKVQRKLADFDSTKASVSTWIFTITRNTVIDYGRTHRIDTPLTEDIPAEGGPEEAAIRRDTLENLAAALRRLPEREREIIVLHYHANNSLHEISDKMSLPYGVVKRAHQSALAHLREAL